MITTQVTEIGAIVVISVLIAAFARNRGWNPSLLLLGTGLLIGLVPIGPDAPADPEFVLVVVLAPLVFGEALSSSIVDMRRVQRPILALAIGLVIVGAFVVGALTAALVPTMPLNVALCLGAILGPTDAVAVSATARAAALPRRIVDILEGESLVNDGTALTLLRVFSLAAAAGSVTPLEGTAILATSVVGGLVVGAAGGGVLVLIARRARDTTVANGVILIAPFPIYAVAEQVHGSGILAVVLAALMLAHVTSSEVAYTGRLQATNIWRTVIFILQAVAFFLVGLDVPLALGVIGPERRDELLVVVPLIVLALIATRFLFVFAMTSISGTRRVVPHGWIVIAWASTRGPISALAAFTLPLTLDSGEPFPDRAFVISITFCVVLVSLLLAPTMAPLARRLHLPADDDQATVHWVRVALARASLDRLEEISQRAERRDRPLPADLVDGLRGNAESRLERESVVQEHGEEALPEDRPLRRRVMLEMAHAEQEELLRLRNQEGLPDSLMRNLQKDLDYRVRAIRASA